jgi:hypothetical protein
MVVWYYIFGAIAAALAVGAAALAFLKQVWKFLRNLEKAVDAFPVLIEIASEFKTNGGSSLRDAVNRIETNQEVDHQLVVDHIAADAAFQERVEPFLLGAQ